MAHRNSFLGKRTFDGPVAKSSPKVGNLLGMVSDRRNKQFSFQYLLEHGMSHVLAVVLEVVVGYRVSSFTKRMVPSGPSISNSTGKESWATLFSTRTFHIPRCGRSRWMSESHTATRLCLGHSPTWLYPPRSAIRLRPAARYCPLLVPSRGRQVV